MTILFYILLFIFWTSFWSFASVIIFRLKSKEKGILTGRSHCTSCNNTLNFFQLIPIFSWIFWKWKCFYCKTKVSWIYPILEITTWLLFSFIWYFLIDFNLILNLNIIEIIKLFFWLTLWVITIIYTFYDILFLEIHEAVWISAIWLIIWVLALQTTFPEFHIINTLPAWIENLKIWYTSIILTVTIIWMLYLIMIKEFHELTDILIIFTCIMLLYTFKKFFLINLSDIAIINWLIWALWIFIFFFLQIVISSWSRMWWWDLRIALIIWLILWISLSFAWTMITYIIWSLVWTILIIYTKIKKWLKVKFNSQIPFWPFLAIWFFITVFLKEDILKFIEIYFYNM